MSNKLSIIIMAHPERQAWAKELSQKLNAPIVYDTQNNLWDTCRRAWLAHMSIGAEYSLVLQDDAIITENFREKAEAILKDDFIYSFYLSSFLSPRVNIAKKRGKDHVISSMIFNEVALCMKTKHIDKMIEYCDVREAQNDHEIGRWAKSVAKRVYYPIPSLTTHRDSESIYRRNIGQAQPERERKAIEFYA